MREFEFYTGSVPVTGGAGIQWDDGTITYRLSVGPAITEPVNGSLEDLAHYSGHEGYSFHWADEPVEGPASTPAPVPTAPDVTGLDVDATEPSTEEAHYL